MMLTTLIKVDRKIPCIQIFSFTDVAVTRDIGLMVRGEHSLNILAPQPLQIGIDSVLKILN